MPLINYRLDPFNDTLNTVTITNEIHIIPSSSPFTIQLCEAPKKDAPSTISLKIDGVIAQEVAAVPAQGQFWPDYSTNADGNEHWNTGAILFNSADAGKTVSVTYKATGSIVWADTVNTYVFMDSGSIIAPQWAKVAYISGCAGGGGGGGSNAAGAAGGTTSFGSLLSLGGGGGGGGRGLLQGNMEAGANGITMIGLVPAEAGRYIDMVKNIGSTGFTAEFVYRGGAGGSGPFGQGGNPRYRVKGDGNDMQGNGRGGGGGGALFTGGGGGGGGAGGACADHRIRVVGGRKYTITIGAGGVGGSGAQKGGDGTKGRLIVRWGA